MAPPHLFLFGSQDLSQYLRVNDGEGLDPFDSDGFEEPQFTEGPFTEGQTLTNVDIDNRAQVWPLYLNSSSKDQLHLLQQAINRELRYGAQPLRVAWRDAGATQTTFYDVAYARFDPEFSMRKGQRGWLAGTLRVWGQPPYGHTGTERVLGTSTATGPQTLALGSVAGDVDALLNFQVGIPSRALPSQITLLPPKPLYTLVSVMGSSWVPYYPAASILSGAGTLTGASGAMGSQVLRKSISAGGPMDLNIYLSDPAVYDTPARILLEVRSSGTQPVVFDLVGAIDGNVPTVAVPSFLPNGWQVVDLGVMSRAVATPIGVVIAAHPSYVAAQTVDVAGVFILPEARTAIVVDTPSYTTPQTFGASYAINGTGSSTRTDNVGVFGGFRGQYSVDHLIRGSIPRARPGMMEKAFVVNLFNGAVSNGFAYNVRITVRERFTFAR